jgi:hypothetical protein
MVVLGHPRADSLDRIYAPRHRLDLGAHPRPLTSADAMCQPVFDLVSQRLEAVLYIEACQYLGARRAELGGLPPSRGQR